MSDLEQVGDSPAERRTRAEERLQRLGALHEELDVTLPGVPHPPVDLDALLADEALAVARSRLRHGGSQRSAWIVLGHSHHGEVSGGAGLLNLDEHVGALVLDGLEGPDRLVELATVLGV